MGGVGFFPYEITEGCTYEVEVVDGGGSEFEKVCKFGVDTLAQYRPDSAKGGFFAEHSGFCAGDLGADSGEMDIGRVRCNEGTKNACGDIKRYWDDGSDGVVRVESMK